MLFKVPPSITRPGCKCTQTHALPDEDEGQVQDACRYLVQVRRQHRVRGLPESSKALEARLDTLHNLCLLHLRLLARSNPPDELVHARSAQARDPLATSHEHGRRAAKTAVHAASARARGTTPVRPRGSPPERGDLGGHVGEEPLGALPPLPRHTFAWCRDHPGSVVP